MKWAILIGGLVLGVVAGLLLRKRESLHPYIVGAIGFLPWFAIRRTSISVFFENYPRGDSMGLEITFVDFFAIVALVAFGRRRSAFPYPVAVPLYVFFALVSIALSPRPELAFFSFWKLLRMVMLLVALAWAFEDPRRPPWWLKGVALGITYQFIQAVQQRFVEGLDQAMGTFPHQNSMAMALNLIIPIVLAILLAGQGRLFGWLTAALGSVCVVLSLSRGSMTMMVVAVVLVYFVSSTRRFTVRKNLVAAAGVVAFVLLAAVSFKSVMHRFESAPEESAAGRAMYEKEASEMLSDHPFGIGLNQWSYVSSSQGYAARAGLEPQDRAGIVHHIYWLTLAELGYLGFVAFLILIAAPIRRALPQIWRHRDDVRGDVLAGAVIALTAMHVHGTLEWIWRQTEVGYVYWSVTALVWALSRQMAQPARDQVARSRMRP